jgi:hypothetical protein
MKMKNTKKLLVIAVILSVVLVACKKSTTNTTTTPLYSSSNIVFDTNKIVFQVKSWNLSDSSRVNNNQDSALVFSGGTQIIFKDSSFLTYLGLDTPHWYLTNAKICVKELYKNSDWIFSNMQTVDSGRRAIQSFGAICLAVVDQNGDTVIDLDTHHYHAPDTTDWLNRAQFHIKIPASGNGVFDWNPNNLGPTAQIYVNDRDTINTPPNLLTYPTLNWWTYPYNLFNFIYPTWNQPYYYTFAIKDSLSSNRWYNLADPNASINNTTTQGLTTWSSGLTTTLTIQNSTSSSYADAQIFFVLDAPWKVTVIKAVRSVINSTQFLIPNVPLNVHGKIVAWCVSSGNQLYSNYNTTNGSFQVINPVSLTNNTLTILYQQVAISDLTNYIKAIN